MREPRTEHNGDVSRDADGQPPARGNVPVLLQKGVRHFFFFIKYKKGSDPFSGQSSLEYALVLALTVTAMLIGMSTYMRRSLQARYRSVVDGSVEAVGGGRNQYEPYYSTEGQSISGQNWTATSRWQGGKAWFNGVTNALQEPVIAKGKMVPISQGGVNLAADDAW